MTNILLNISNFDEPWAYDTMVQYLKPETKVCILPLSYFEGWITDAMEWEEKYGKGQEYYEELVRPFRSFGIKDKNISWVNYYQDDEDSAKRKIRNADVLFFTGGYPDWMMQRLFDLGIQDEIREYEGVVMGTSAGALIQLDHFHLAPDGDYEFQYQDGLGLLEGFDIDVHYEDDIKHIEAVIRSIEDTGRNVICYPNQGGVLLEGDEFALLGGAFIVGPDDLDELYEAYEQLKQ